MREISDRFGFPAAFIAEPEGGFVIRFLDFPEAITQGDSVPECHQHAADCLEEAVAGRITRGEKIPTPSKLKKGALLPQRGRGAAGARMAQSKGVHPVKLSARMAAKASLYLAANEAGVSKTELASSLGCDEAEVGRLMDPRYPSEIQQIEAALAVMGKRLVRGRMKTNVPAVCFVGKSGTGKTTLLEKLIPELKRRGHRVGTVKHHAHAGFDIDREGKDTWRHAQAGSDHVIIAAPDKIASIRTIPRELTLAEVVLGMTDVDLVLVEGYKRSDFPKIEILREAAGKDPICTADEVIAMITDLPNPFQVPAFGLDNMVALADFLEKTFLSPRWGVCHRKAMDGVCVRGLSSTDGARARNRPDGEAFSGLSPKV